MQISENDSKVDIYHKDSKDNSVIVMITDDKEDTVVIVFSGTFTTENVMKMLQK
jgi:glucose-6-phosphate isomerase